MVGPGDAFYVLDLSAIQAVYANWSKVLPHIKPYYAVKCNPTQAIVSELARLGSNFDCASPAEIQQVLDLGVDPDRILYANPCKRIEDIVFAKERGVCLSTFDSECELRKLAQVFGSECKLILRIRADDPKARCPLGNKYGAEEREWDVLLFTARSLGLDIVGISFHVGSCASSPKVFSLALAKAKKAMRLAKKYGYDPKIIDIGGGFSSSTGLPNIKPIKGVELIAEPGRFFVERAMELHTPVIGTKGTGLTISESLYGAFNCILFDHAQPQVKEVRDEFGNKIDGLPIRRTIFGSTCDGADVIYKEYDLPEGTDLGSWVVWKNMGAYTCAAATRFNGIQFNDRPIILL
jgi:ornithine decarboxylase